MDSQHSDLLDVVARLREAARRGDWTAAAGFMNALLRHTPPDRQEDLGEYLGALKDALAVAKTSRAGAAASLARLNAAAKFNRGRLDSASVRQNFAASADF